MHKTGAARAAAQGRARVSCTGHELKEMFSVATCWLEKNAPAINALNVFPVPDGDTGTNMLLTMRSTMGEAARLQVDSVPAVAQAMARGALMGARGNSGVILSQIVRGIADGLGEGLSFGPTEMARAFGSASQLARKAISKPQEGTIITVMTDVAAAANRVVVNNHADLVGFMEVVVREAQKSVDRTPELLEVLKQANVVDAGGQGLQVILDGMLHYLKGEADEVTLLEIAFPATLRPALVVARTHTGEKVYGYCTEFIVRGNDLNPEWIRKTIEANGDSVVVGGDATTVKVHVHTPHPGVVLEFGSSLGSLHGLKIENMDEQNEQFIHMLRAPVPAASIAVVSVVAGDGLEEVFRSLGVTAVVSGGQSMNPSTEEILRAVESVPSDNVIVLPNNKNVVLAAQQAAKLCKKKVSVLATKSIPQGMAAMMAFNCEMQLERNLAEMAEAQQKVRSVEVTRAVRVAKVGELDIKEGQVIGLVDGDIRVACDDIGEAVARSLESAGLDNAEILTVYYGADVSAEEARNLVKALGEKYPSQQVELVHGSQPHYSYIISVE